MNAGLSNKISSQPAKQGLFGAGSPQIGGTPINMNNSGGTPMMNNSGPRGGGMMQMA